MPIEQILPLVIAEREKLRRGIDLQHPAKRPAATGQNFGRIEETACQQPEDGRRPLV
jgi:hypothetical protein